MKHIYINYSLLSYLLIKNKSRIKKKKKLKKKKIIQKRKTNYIIFKKFQKLLLKPFFYKEFFILEYQIVFLEK